MTSKYLKHVQLAGMTHKLRLLVPVGIKRIDAGSTKGWQVGCSGTKFFSDATQDPTTSLRMATIELIARLRAKPVQFTDHSIEDKTTPVGISGPTLVTKRSGKSRRPYYEYKVTLPRFGERRHSRTVYIATIDNFTREVEKEALEKCIALRDRAIKEWRQGAQAEKKARLQILQEYLQSHL